LLFSRSLFDAVDDDLEDDTPALQLASALVQLERLELVSQLPLQHFGHRPPLPLYWGNTTFALPWLRGLQQLQHLAGPLVYAAQVCCQGRALRGRVPPTNDSTAA
jgi:hypothetical protein